MLETTVFESQGQFQIEVTVKRIMPDCYYFQILPKREFRALIKEYSVIASENWVERHLNKIKQNNFNWGTKSIIKPSIGDVFFVDLVEKDRLQQQDKFYNNNLLSDWEKIALPALSFIDKIGDSNYEPMYFKENCIFNQHKECVYCFAPIKITQQSTQHPDYPSFVQIVLDKYLSKNQYEWHRHYPNSQTKWPTSTLLNVELPQNQLKIPTSPTSYEDSYWLLCQHEFASNFKEVFSLFKEINIDYDRFIGYNANWFHFLIGKTSLALEHPELIDFLFSDDCPLYVAIPGTHEYMNLWQTQQSQVKTYLLKERLARHLVEKNTDRDNKKSKI